MSEASDALLEGFDDLLSQHGKPVTITTRGGLVLSFVGIFEDPSLNGTIGQTTLENDNRPRIACYSSDVIGAARDDVVAFNGTNYTLLEILSDGDTHSSVVIGPYYP